MSEARIQGWKVVQAFEAPPSGGAVLTALVNAPAWVWRPDLETAGWICAQRDASGGFNVKAIVTSTVRGHSRGVDFNGESIVACAKHFESDCVVLIHNHPSGDSWPSVTDEDSTEKLRGILGARGVTLVDHLILGAWELTSVADRLTVSVEGV